MSLASAFEKVFGSKEGADCTFLVHNQELPAHQFILANRSPVLKAMIKGPMAPPSQRHEIIDPQITFDDFNNFVKFLYTEKCDVSLENVEVLFRLSDMYDVPDLFEFCANTLPKSLKPKDLLKFAEMGMALGNKSNVVNKCLNEVPNKARYSYSPLQYESQSGKVWSSSELVLEFVKYCPRTDSFKEEAVFEITFEWAKGQCKEKNLEINTENLKELMSPFVQHFDLEKISLGILTSTIFDYELIPEKQLLKRFVDHFKKEVKKQNLPLSNPQNMPMQLQPLQTQFYQQPPPQQMTQQMQTQFHQQPHSKLMQQQQQQQQRHHQMQQQLQPQFHQQPPHKQMLQ
uniref:BTB domain-containing protein n=1 Tax=Panagrolaimus davidi TaxID=227884 RepID=A0A914PKJ4_9BILA